MENTNDRKNFRNEGGQQNQNSGSQSARRGVDDLLENNLCIEPSSVVYNFSSERIEDCILTWLEKTFDIDTSSIIIRCVLKDDIKYIDKLQDVAARTPLPFVVVLFKTITNKDISYEHGLNKDVEQAIRHALNNFSDKAQFSLREDTKLTNAIANLTVKGKVKWYIKKKPQLMAYTALDSDKVMSICFAKGPEEIGKYVFDFLEKPRAHKNMNKGQSEFFIRLGVSRYRVKNRPKVDPISFISGSDRQVKYRR